MSLNNIQLPTYLVGELYKNSLLDIDNQELNSNLIKHDELNYLGKNEKNILLIVDEESAVFLPDDSLTFLIEILSACKLSLSDTALINVFEKKEIKYKLLNENFKPDIILFFGIEPAALEFPLQFPRYQIQKYINQIYLSAPSLDELAADIEKKRQLWVCLKKIFSI